ncbi:signal transduction histidine kinase [Kibdelosporangium banguiense]|uniref:histidine kinase n=1 Tax=Kibdelosporangium banguiense TaxID=1365924 RepID=A0ABS4TXA1_9PSEU|nr:histidine kinase [Kibdelosporangium banguiense]MBP2329041.1 signal transduction histidine kinase [Kibdelosporangium banguiense]
MRASNLARSCAAVGIVLLSVVSFVSPGTGVGVVLLACSAVAVAAVCCLRWPLGPVSFPVAAGAAGSISLAVDVAYGGPKALVAAWLLVEFPALLVVAWLVVRRLPARSAAWLTAVLGLAVVALPVRFALSRDHLAWAPTTFLASTAFFLLVCVLAVAYYLRVQEGRRRAAVLRARRAQRLGIARDLHDFVAHEVTGIVLEAQAARVDMHGAEAFLERIEESGQRALSSMDDMVHALRDEDGALAGRHGLVDLPALVERFAATGEAELDIAPGVGVVPPDTQSLVYLVVLEALTNVRRHAGAGATVRVRVWVDDGAVRVSVVDEGGGRLLHTGRRGGTGLAGLAERVDAAGGRFTAAPFGKGWQVAAAFPLRDS